MGYTGGVSYNGKSVYEEWKYQNITFCLTYAQTYLRQKKCLLTQKAIDAAYSDIFSGVSSCSYVLYRVNDAMNIIKALTAAKEIFDDDGNLTGAIKIQGADTFCNHAVINFYKAGRVSDVPEVPLNDKYRVVKRRTSSDDELKDMRQKRIASVDILDVSSVFGAVKAYQSHYQFLEDVINIKSKSDIHNLVKTMKDVLRGINEIYIERCTAASKMETVLRKASEVVASGTPVYVSYEDGFLYTSIGESAIKTEIGFLIVSELFQNVGIAPCDACMEITDKETLMDFINSFPKNEKRSPEFEGIIKNLSLVVDDSEFSIVISGGF